VASIINATTNGIVNTGDSVATLSLQTGGNTAVAIDTAQIVSLSKSLALLGSTSGSVTIAAPAVSGTTTLTLPATSGTLLQSGTAVTVAQGGTGLTSTPANGALDIGNGTGFTRTTLTAGTNVTITNGAGAITIAASGGGSPGGSTTQVQYNNTGAFAGSANFIWDNTNSRLAVGTASPNTAIEAYTSATGAQALLTLQQADNNGGNSWGIDFRRTAGAGANVVRAKIFAVREGNDANGLAFSYTTSGGTVTQGLTLDSSGKFSIGSAVGGYLSAQGSVNADFVSRIYNNDTSGKGMLLYYSAAAPNSAGVTNAFAMGQDNSAIRWYFSGNGGLNNFSANNTNLSDAREKKNVALAGNYLDKINAIPVKTFLYNDQTDNDLNLGVIAQDVQAVAPELVTESDWGTAEEPKIRLSVYQTDLQYALMKAIQELTARVAALEVK